MSTVPTIARLPSASRAQMAHTSKLVWKIKDMEERGHDIWDGKWTMAVVQDWANGEARKVHECMPLLVESSNDLMPQMLVGDFVRS